jgi:hypothetical protein
MSQLRSCRGAADGRGKRRHAASARDSDSLSAAAEHACRLPRPAAFSAPPLFVHERYAGNMRGEMLLSRQRPPQHRKPSVRQCRNRQTSSRPARPVSGGAVAQVMEDSCRAAHGGSRANASSGA